MKFIQNIAYKIKYAVIRRVVGKWGSVSYSQEGEDILLSKYLTILHPDTPVHYVDIGAHHPIRFSNTYLFYQQGGNGINIDAMPGSMKSFQKIRHRDINLEIGIGEREEIRTYFSFSEPAVNTFDKELAEVRVNQGYKLLKEYMVPIKRLSDILDEHWSKEKGIDFITIDTEGYEMQVLASNDWKKYRPHFIVVEALNIEFLEDVEKLELVTFMKEKGYKLISRLFNTLFFKEVNCMEYSKQ